MLSQLRKQIRGKIVRHPAALAKYSHDTSLFEIKPRAIIYPKNSDDVMKTVKFVSSAKHDYPNLSITARSGGTDMSGGAINDSLIMVFDRYMKKINKPHGLKIVAEPGAYYRKFERITKREGKIMPSYPASKNIAALGGMVANRAGGEKSLTYGTTERYVRRLKVVLSDGHEYELKPLKKAALERKLKKKGFEGELYRKLHRLIEKNYDFIKSHRPGVSKNTTGYALWDVWDRDQQVFDLSKLFVGSQGTLGLVTEIEFGLVRAKPHSGLLIGYMSSLDDLGGLITEVVKHNPSSFETFDDHTLKFAIRFFFQFRKTLGLKKFIKLGLSFIPDVFIMLRQILSGKGLPKLIVLIEYEANDVSEIKRKIGVLRRALEAKDFEIDLEEAETENKSERFWLMRRESFNLLRKNVKGAVHAAPFIDDMIVPPEVLPQFLPKFRRILEKYELLYTIAGHMGDGNFHVIPLMDFSDAKEVAKIEPALKECVKLVKKYGGSMSGEHNDGLVRGPFLKDMYGPKMYGLFKEVKQLFDPLNIFNPHKKTDADWDYSSRHMRKHF